MKRSPFTAVCQQVAGLLAPRRADLHVHTTASDGEYTPSQVVALARQARLCAVAVTDHDTLAAVPEAVAHAGTAVEVVPGVEITTQLDGRELHLLAYFVRTDHAGLNAALGRMCDRRRDRFRDYLRLLADAGATVPADRARLVEEASASLGRRHVAGLLVTCGFAKTMHAAFGRFLAPLSRTVVPKDMLDVGAAIDLAHAAGGVASLAHPPADFGDAEFARLREMGLDAVEVHYPWGRSSPASRLLDAAARHGLLVTGGSDCHGPDPAHRRIGSHALPADGLDRLRQRCRLPA